jgi:hypothetical protein
MLHSYWFGYAGKTFRSVLEKDPGCAIAYWGLALDLLGNTLSGPPSRPNADAAWKLLEEARGIPVKTDREAAWLEAIRAYFRNHDSVPVADRLVAYNAEMKKLASSYPDDVEAQVFYALTLQASAPKTDLTYANQLESAAILERVYAAIRATRAPRTSSSTPTTTRRWPNAASRRPAAMRRSRLPCLTRGTCRRTSTRWSACGRTRSPRICRRSRYSRTTRTLELFFGNKTTFRVMSTPVNKSKTYDRFSDMADDVVNVRIYQGIHFRSADEVARRQGTRAADWAFSHVLRPVK